MNKKTFHEVFDTGYKIRGLIWLIGMILMTWLTFTVGYPMAFIGVAMWMSAYFPIFKLGRLTRKYLHLQYNLLRYLKGI